MTPLMFQTPQNDLSWAKLLSTNDIRPNLGLNQPYMAKKVGAVPQNAKIGHFWAKNGPLWPLEMTWTEPNYLVLMILGLI